MVHKGCGCKILVELEALLLAVVGNLAVHTSDWLEVEAYNPAVVYTLAEACKVVGAQRLVEVGSLSAMHKDRKKQSEWHASWHLRMDRVHLYMVHTILFVIYHLQMMPMDLETFVSSLLELEFDYSNGLVYSRLLRSFFSLRLAS